MTEEQVSETVIPNPASEVAGLPVIDPNEQEQTKIENAELSLSLQYDDQNDLFSLTFLKSSASIFQVKMAPHDFEKLSCDMIKTIKNYNLFKAQLYKDMLEREKAVQKQESEKCQGTKPPESESSECVQQECCCESQEQPTSV